MTRKTERSVRALVVAALLAFTLAGCSESVFARRDQITPWSGDDLAQNAAIQTINPWPRAAFEPPGPTRGSKVENAMKLYRAPPKQTGVAASGAASPSGSGAGASATSN
ncbi:MAG TPA: hypothetical protein VMU56_03415 [Beijerinckiaceae bacterium]|nr:hypothetical protein [Beijerinckiaceae bacterium]HVB89595.1 hypothetical protein [Beijerinckiaceae bacterium]